MAFTTVSGSNGFTSLTGTTGVDIANIVTLNSNVVIAANTGDDNVTANPGSGDRNLEGWNVNMGGDDDTFVLGGFGNNLLNSFIQLDGATPSNDGDDTFNAANSSTIIASTLRALGGEDTLTLGALDAATINGNKGNDEIVLNGVANNSEIMGGQDIDTIDIFGSTSVTSINGNKGIDTITLFAAANVGTTVYGGQGGDTIRTTFNTSDGLEINGDKGADNITDGAGDSTINGGEDADTINGGAGADTITGGTGDATDVFVYTTLTDSTITGNTGFDTITDFTVADDDFQLSTAATIGATATVGLGTAAATLEATIAAATVAFAGANDVQFVNITDSVSFAGQYVVIGSAAAAYDNTTDAVIKVSTITGMGAGNFI